ncbi:hypothetical protein [Nostoc sp. ChiQUE01b]|uniref:hypothetical protein n=1 Tax=Nostoc sp. ChiQUE01b TaxID=3075376 RepID=UPI002AD26688|nr:hypothetical protein [Nostoc sp. ChiQUE01b]MDZ8260618.1 hypothetical protein [Nostoc sp. ChiQUE01b]
MEKEEKVYLRTRIPKEIHREFKKASIDDGRTMEDIAADLIQDWLDERNISQENVSNRNYDLAATTFLTMLANGIRPSDSELQEVAHATNIEIELLYLLCDKLFNDIPIAETNEG